MSINQEDWELSKQLTTEERKIFESQLRLINTLHDRYVQATVERFQTNAIRRAKAKFSNVMDSHEEHVDSDPFSEELIQNWKDFLNEEMINNDDFLDAIEEMDAELDQLENDHKFELDTANVLFQANNAEKSFSDEELAEVTADVAEDIKPMTSVYQQMRKDGGSFAIAYNNNNVQSQSRGTEFDGIAALLFDDWNEFKNSVDDESYEGYDEQVALEIHSILEQLASLSELQELTSIYNHDLEETNQDYPELVYNTKDVDDFVTAMTDTFLKH